MIQTVAASDETTAALRVQIARWSILIVERLPSRNFGVDFPSRSRVIITRCGQQCVDHDSVDGGDGPAAGGLGNFGAGGRGGGDVNRLAAKTGAAVSADWPRLGP